ncbi:MAG: hypothetical protein AAFX57_15725, partial [Bacteroidota bacterium]
MESTTTYLTYVLYSTPMIILLIPRVDEFGKVIYTQKSLTEYMEKTFNKVENTNAPYPSMSHQITYLDPKIGVVHSMQ